MITDDDLRAFFQAARNGDGPATKARYPFATPQELRARTGDTPRWIWDGYFAEGWLTIVGGRPKAGKSSVVFGVAEACGCGTTTTFLGRTIRLGPVVIITEEVGMTAAAKLPDCDDIRILTREAVWPKPPLADLIAAGVEEAKRIGAVMLVLDSFAFWSGLTSDGENDAGAVQPALDLLLEAAATGIAVVVVHHQRKSGGEDGTALRGSGAIAGSADAILEIERVEDARPTYRRLVAVSRMPSTPPLLVVDHDPEERSWRVVGEGSGREDSASVSWRGTLLNVLPTGEPGITQTEIQQATGKQRNKWGEALNGLVDEGRARRTGTGGAGNPYRYFRTSGEPVPEDLF